MIRDDTLTPAVIRVAPGRELGRLAEHGYALIDTLSLRAALEKVPDPRARRGIRYPFTGLLLILVCAIFSGAQTLTTIAEWARHAAGSAALFPSAKVHSPATIRRLAARIDPLALDEHRQARHLGGPVVDP